MNELVFRTVLEALDRGEAVALVTIVKTTGSTPQRVGAKMAVFADGRVVGTIGGGCYEHDASGKAREAIGLRRARVVSYDLDDEAAAHTGLICGGRMEVYIEPVEPSPHLYLVGAGHISQALARVAVEAGFRVHVLDDRAKYADAALYPDGTDVMVDDIPAWLGRASLSAGAYVVIVTRGHRHDLEALRAVVTRPLAYVGMIGSQKKVSQVFEALAADGTPPTALDGVFAPIGLDIGAVTPAEIAVSIVAEMLAVRSGRMAEPRVQAATLRARRLGGAGGV